MLTDDEVLLYVHRNGKTEPRTATPTSTQLLNSDCAQYGTDAVKNKLKNTALKQTDDGASNAACATVVDYGVDQERYLAYPGQQTRE